ncbi:MAG: M67 family metallopeptidase [Anaerolineales bacterium]|jgi:proteasome lid subunit RPN8/RPN11
MTIRLSPDVYTDIRQHLENVYPEEGAGFLLGREQGDLRIVEAALPQPNEFQIDKRRRRYMIEPRDMMAAERYADERGYAIIGIFHSHPDHPPEPSSFDLEWSLPWFSYIITSVRNGKAGISRCWRLNNDRTSFIEEELETYPLHQES